MLKTKTLSLTPSTQPTYYGGTSLFKPVSTQRGDTRSAIKRICMINPQGYVAYPAPLGKTDTGGQVVYILELARALGEKNIHVDIITRQFDDQPSIEYIFKNVRIIRISCGGKKFLQKEKLFEFLPTMMNNFARFIAETGIKYDAIHSHYWDGGYAGILLSKALDIPHIHTPHSLGKSKKTGVTMVKSASPELASTYRYDVRERIEQQIMDNVDAYIAMCNEVKKTIITQYHIDDEKVHVIYPGIETSLFNPQPTIFDKSVQLKPNAIFTASRMVPAKGLDKVIEAVSLLKDKIDFHLYMAGGASGKNSSAEEVVTQQKLQALVKQHKLEDYITFVGCVPHDTLLPAYFRKADIFIIGSTYEPFGMTTLEAMACGAATVVSSTAGSREVVSPKNNGMIVDTSDTNVFAGTLYTLLADARLRDKLKGNAIKAIETSYAWEKIVNKFIVMYTQTIATYDKKKLKPSAYIFSQ